MKSVEYFIKNKMTQQKIDLKSEYDLSDEFFHICATSEDINNLSYSLMIKNSLKLLLKSLGKVLVELERVANEYKSVPMLARTHG